MAKIQLLLRSWYCFYLTDEECKFAYEATDDFSTSSFYLTDEECKFVYRIPMNYPP